MATDLLSILNLQEGSSNICLVSTNGSMDGSFVMHSLVGKKLKSENCSVAIVGFGQSLDHYCSIGSKLGYDLRNSINKGQALFANYSNDIFSLMLNPYLEGKSALKKVMDMISISMLSNAKTVNLKYEKCCFCIDNLSHLLYLGLPLKDVLCVVKRLMQVVVDNNWTLLINTQMIDKGSRNDTYLLASFLRDLCDTNLDITPFAVGKNKDLSGSITVSHHRNLKEITVAPVTYTYKLFERGVKILSTAAISHTNKSLSLK